MGRDNGDATTMVSSSIALLQERFRKLERMKEKRQERQLLKLFSESERVGTTTTTTTTTTNPPSPSPSPSPILPFQYSDHHHHHHVILPSRPPTPSQDHCLLSLGRPNYYSQGKHSEFSSQRNNNIDDTSYISLWPNASGSSSTYLSRNYFDNNSSDVDTSLHL